MIRKAGGGDAAINQPITRERLWLAAAVRLERQCEQCDETYVTNPQGAANGQRFCSYKCRITHRSRDANHHRRTAGRITDVTRADVKRLRQAATTCPLCRERMTDERGPRQKHLDHIVPLNPLVGGTHTLGNVRIICRTCNLTRPHDGSDLAGHQPSLWATDPQAAMAAAVLKAQKPKPLPQSPPPPDPLKQAASLADGIKRDLALLFRLNRMGWQDIADRVGYASAGAAHNGASLGGKRRDATCNL